MNATLQLVDDDYFDEDFEQELREEPAGGYIPLGFEKRHVVVFSRLQKSVFKLRPADMRQANLRFCFGSDWYDFQSEATTKGRPQDARKRKPGDVSAAVGKMVIQACQKAGHYQPTAERGTGAWPDGEGGLLINSNELWRHDGTVLEHGPFGQHVYPMGKPLGYGPETPAASAAEVSRLLESFRSYNWQGSFGSEFLLGWIGTSIVASALRRRPHMLVTGTRGSGKSTLLQQVCALLGPSAAPMTGSPTMVGLQQHVQDFPARAVVIDEFESDGRSVNRKGVCEAARASYSVQEGDAGLVRGSPTGEAKTYKMASPFLAGGISIGPMEPADVSRWVVLELAKCAMTENGVAPMTTDELRPLGPKLARLFVSRWPALSAGITVFKDAVQAFGGDARAGDTFGTLLACYWTFISGEVVTEDEAERIVEASNVAARLKTHDVSDEQECLAALLTKLVAVEGVGSKLAISEACRIVTAGGPERLAVEARLAQLGMRLRVSKLTGRWNLLVANSENHAEIRRLFAGTKWSRGGWGVVLRRLPGGHASTQRLGKGLQSCKVTAFELPAELDAKPAELTI